MPGRYTKNVFCAHNALAQGNTYCIAKQFNPPEPADYNYQIYLSCAIVSSAQRGPIQHYHNAEFTACCDLAVAMTLTGHAKSLRRRYVLLAVDRLPAATAFPRVRCDNGLTVVRLLFALSIGGIYR